MEADTNTTFPENFELQYLHIGCEVETYDGNYRVSPSSTKGKLSTEEELDLWVDQLNLDESRLDIDRRCPRLRLLCGKREPFEQYRDNMGQSLLQRLCHVLDNINSTKLQRQDALLGGIHFWKYDYTENLPCNAYFMRPGGFYCDTLRKADFWDPTLTVYYSPRKEVVLCILLFNSLTDSGRAISESFLDDLQDQNGSAVFSHHYTAIVLSRVLLNHYLKEFIQLEAQATAVGAALGLESNGRSETEVLSLNHFDQVKEIYSLNNDFTPLRFFVERQQHTLHGMKIEAEKPRDSNNAYFNRRGNQRQNLCEGRKLSKLQEFQWLLELQEERHKRNRWLDGSYEQAYEDTLTSIRQLQADNDELLKALGFLQARVGFLGQAIWSLAALKEARVSTKIAESSQKIAMSTMRDSSTMKSIAVLTMVFLPVTAVAAVLDTPFFNLAGDKLVGTGLQTFWLIIIPLTVSVMLFWFLLARPWKNWEDSHSNLTDMITLKARRNASALPAPGLEIISASPYTELPPNKRALTFRGALPAVIQALRRGGRADISSHTEGRDIELGSIRNHHSHSTRRET